MIAPDMKFIIIYSRHHKQCTATVNVLFIVLALAGVLGVAAALGYSGYRFGVGEAALNRSVIARWQELLGEQQQAVEETKLQVGDSLDATALRIAQLQARVVRLDALGERLIGLGRLDGGEFDFTQPPALGGPETSIGASSHDTPDLMRLLNRLSQDIADREKQLGLLETLLDDRKMQAAAFLAGRPVDQGWISSRYGYRNDPITGKRGWHNGIDFAGKAGTDVVAVARGLVMYAGYRPGYGKMVEINHGGGYITRYGHQSDLLVKAGEVVKKGEVVGLMGSSGRSTGPHVHFEIHKNGRAVDPVTYIRRASR